MEKYVAYYRLSKEPKTQEDFTLIKNKGIGIDAQMHSVKSFVSGKGQIVEHFTEYETGTGKRKRVEIYKAMQLCKETKATLVIARLDRLTRDTDFLTELRRSGVKFVACDYPSVNELMIDILVAFAKDEARNISIRTKAALASLKRSGKQLGKTEWKKEDQLKGSARKREIALSNENNVKATDLIIDLRQRGMSFQAIADRLNKRNDRTSVGKPFTSCAVHRLFTRAEAE